jgi:hypothetical protein
VTVVVAPDPGLNGHVADVGRGVSENIRLAALLPDSIHAAKTASSSCARSCLGRGGVFLPRVGEVGGTGFNPMELVVDRGDAIALPPLSFRSSAAVSAAEAASQACHTLTMAPVTPAASRSMCSSGDSGASSFGFVSSAPTLRSGQ